MSCRGERDVCMYGATSVAIVAIKPRYMVYLQDSIQEARVAQIGQSGAPTCMDEIE